jgi:phosphoribosylglycinamide formyltransferase-1
MRLAVFVSGNGSNLQCIIDAIQNKILVGTEIDLVVADRNCFAIERARSSNVKVLLIDRKSIDFDELDRLLKKDNISHIILVGFLSIIEKLFCDKWKNKIINLHPSLLPKYGGKGMYGLKVHQAVIVNKETESGATIHYVSAGVDEGDIILQKKCEVEENETALSLQTKIHVIEKEILIESLKILYAKAQSANQRI